VRGDFNKISTAATLGCKLATTIHWTYGLAAL